MNCFDPHAHRMWCPEGTRPSITPVFSRQGVRKCKAANSRGWDFSRKPIKSESRRHEYTEDGGPSLLPCERRTSRWLSCKTRKRSFDKGSRYGNTQYFPFSPQHTGRRGSNARRDLCDNIRGTGNWTRNGIWHCSGAPVLIKV